MNTYEKWLDDDAWQRVVDNELTAAELKQLVAVCEQHPEFWKRCAVAFLEEQAIEHELRQLTKNSAVAQRSHDSLLKTSSSALLDRQLSNTAVPDSETHDDLATRSSVGKFSSRNVLPSLLSSLGLAASVMLAFVIGWQASQRFGERNISSSNIGSRDVGNARSSTVASPVSHATDNVAVEPSTAESQRRIAQASKLPTSAADFDVALSNSQLSTMPQLEPSLTVGSDSALSVQDAIEQALERPNPFVLVDSRVPEPLAELEQRGLVHIESTAGFVPVTLKNGRTAVVPVQQFDVRPLRNTY